MSGQTDNLDHDDPGVAVFDHTHGMGSVEEALNRISTTKQERPSVDFYPIFKLPTLSEAGKAPRSAPSQAVAGIAFNLARQCAFHDDGAAFAQAAQIRLGYPKSFLVRIAAYVGGGMPERLGIFQGVLSLTHAEMRPFVRWARSQFCTSSEKMIAMLSSSRETGLWRPTGARSYAPLIEALAKEKGMELALGWAQSQALAAELGQTTGAGQRKPGLARSL